MPSTWNDQEYIDGLKHKLHCTNSELESARVEAKQEIDTYKEAVSQLYQLMKKAYQERDEARNQMNKLWGKLRQSTQYQPYPMLPNFKFETLPPALTKPNTSPVNSERILDSNFTPNTENSLLRNFRPQKDEFLRDFNGSMQLGVVCSINSTVNSDPASVLIDHLVGERPLPQKGRLFQTVVQSGPLLQTLLVEPPPRWKNPPPPLAGSFDYSRYTDEKANRIRSSSLCFDVSSGSSRERHQWVWNFSSNSSEEKPYYVEFNSDCKGFLIQSRRQRG